MRLDRFLWWARLAKTRSAAQALATTGTLRIDGRVITRAHCDVRVGNVVTFFAGNRVRIVRVEALPARRGPAPEAQGCYTDLAPAIRAEPGEQKNDPSTSSGRTGGSANVSQQGPDD